MGRAANQRANGKSIARAAAANAPNTAVAASSCAALHPCAAVCKRTAMALEKLASVSESFDKLILRKHRFWQALDKSPSRIIWAKGLCFAISRGESSRPIDRTAMVLNAPISLRAAESLCAVLMLLA